MSAAIAHELRARAGRTIVLAGALNWAPFRSAAYTALMGRREPRMAGRSVQQKNH